MEDLEPYSVPIMLKYGTRTLDFGDTVFNHAEIRDALNLRMVEYGIMAVLL